jgi:lysophospholipase L1-like esterase
MPLTYLALGDSYTIGEGVAPAERWPAQLAARLRGEGVPLGEPEILATTGWTTDELAAAMDGAAFAPPYDLVSLLIGVNNQYRGRGAEAYRHEFHALLARAIALAGGRPSRLLVLSIPDWGVTAFAQSDRRGGARIGAELDDFNAIARDEARRAGAAWIDVTGFSRQHPDWLVADGLHPDGRQYALWTGAALAAARHALSRSV